MGITPSVIIQNPMGTAAFNASFSALVYLFLVSRQEMAMPKGGIMEPTNFTASGSMTPSIISPLTNVDMVLFTGPPKSKHAIPPSTAPNTNFDPLCRLEIASVRVT